MYSQLLLRTDVRYKCLYAMQCNSSLLEKTSGCIRFALTTTLQPPINGDATSVGVILG